MKSVSLTHIDAVAVNHNPNVQKRMMITPGELSPLVQFAQATFPPGECVERHCHDSMHEIFFVQQGHGIFTVNGEEHRLNPGACLLVESGEEHGICNSGKESLVILFLGIEE